MGLQSCKLYGYRKTKKKGKNFINSRDRKLLQVRLSTVSKNFTFSNKHEIASIARYFVSMQELPSMSLNQSGANMTPP